MIQATRIPGPPSDNQTLRKSPPNNALDRFDSRGRRDRDGFRLPGWLKHFARSLGTMKAHFGTAVVKPAAYPPVPTPPDRRATQEPEPDEALDGFDWLGWLKHFVVYLCAVALICLTGLYFLWQIPFLRDPSQLLVMIEDSRAPRPTTATPPPVTPAPAVQVAPNPPPVNTAAAPSPPPVNTAVAPGQPSVPTEAVVATTSPAAPPTELANAQPSLEPQPAAAPDGQVEPTPSSTQPTAEAVPPPTPQAEIEQLLTDAQQQMDNRRFTAPASGNALSTYRRILELQPNHPAALEGIQRITTYYQDIAQQSLQQGRLDESLAYINRGLRATPKSDALLNLRRQVQQVQKVARQREREEQQKQAALVEEMQRQQLEQTRQEQQRRQQEQQLPWWRQQPTSNQSSGFNQR